MPVFNNFQTVAPMPQSVFERYGDQVGPQIAAMWREHGVGFVDDGFLKVIDPIWFEDQGFVYLRTGVPIFLTALCDTIMFIPDTGTFTAMKLRFGAMDIVTEPADDLTEVLRRFGDPTYREQVLESRHFTEAAAVHGVPDLEQGFQYVPMLALGGPHRAANLSRGHAAVSQSLLLQAEPPTLRAYGPSMVRARADS